MARAIELAECGELVARLENGLDTVVSAGGARLSGGERQRVCLARAILKDAPILLLDEPTANLDLENEYKIQQVLLRMMADKTVVLVSHRLRMAVPGAADSGDGGGQTRRLRSPRGTARALRGIRTALAGERARRDVAVGRCAS